MCCCLLLLLLPMIISFVSVNHRQFLRWYIWKLSGWHILSQNIHTRMCLAFLVGSISLICWLKIWNADLLEIWHFARITQHFNVRYPSYYFRILFFISSYSSYGEWRSLWWKLLQFIWPVIRDHKIILFFPLIFREKRMQINKHPLNLRKINEVRTPKKLNGIVILNCSCHKLTIKFRRERVI